MDPKQRKTVTTSIILETRMPRKDDCFPVKLRVTYQRKQKFYVVRYVPIKIGDDFTDNQKFWLGKIKKGISLTKKEFEKIRKGSSTEPFKTMSIYLNTQEAEAQTTIAKIKNFSFEEFESRYFAKDKDDQDALTAIKRKIGKLRGDSKINTAVTYECTLGSLKDFTKEERLPFSNITVPFLNEYEKWMLQRTKGKKNPKKLSKTTVSIYLRCLRSIFNEPSMPEGTLYPFSRKPADKLFKIPKWNHNKRALTQADVAKIANYKAIKGTMEQKSRDLWLFSYLCNGINFKDLANLKYSNIKSDTIVFERAKTAKSSDEDSEITVIITRQIGKIIDNWGCKPMKQDQFIFPILTGSMSPEEQHSTIKQMVKNTNKYMRRICASLEIPEATTYVARHSFATVLKRSGASVEYISESMGHKNISTTQNYLKDFEIDEKRKWAEKLLPDPESKI